MFTTVWAIKDSITNTLALKVFEPVLLGIGLKSAVSPETLASLTLPFLLLPLLFTLNTLIT
jgi:hypothetical protein